MRPPPAEGVDRAGAARRPLDHGRGHGDGRRRSTGGPLGRPRHRAGSVHSVWQVRRVDWPAWSHGPVSTPPGPGRRGIRVQDAEWSAGDIVVARLDLQWFPYREISEALIRRRSPGLPRRRDRHGRGVPAAATKSGSPCRALDGLAVDAVGLHREDRARRRRAREHHASRRTGDAERIDIGAAFGGEDAPARRPTPRPTSWKGRQGSNDRADAGKPSVDRILVGEPPRSDASEGGAARGRV